jgi:hypothetical protein
VFVNMFENKRDAGASVRMYVNRQELTAIFELRSRVATHRGELTQRPLGFKSRNLTYALEVGSCVSACLSPFVRGTGKYAAIHGRGDDQFRAGTNCQSGDRQRNCKGAESAFVAQLSEVNKG